MPAAPAIQGRSRGEGNEMNIRQAKRSDLDALVRLNRDVQEMHVRFRPAEFRPANHCDTADALAEIIDDDRFRVSVAEDNGTATGYVIVEFRHQSESAFKCSWECLLIHQIAVAPPYRRKGVATALLQHAQGLAAQAGLTRLEIDVYAANQDAKAFYAARGFQTFRELMEKDITPQDVTAAKKESRR